MIHKDGEDNTFLVKNMSGKNKSGKNMRGEERSELSQRIDKIEAAYEFMLAYAAQGLESDKNAGQGQDIRQSLNDIDAAAEGLTKVATSVAEEKNGSEAAGYSAFLDSLDSDARSTQGAVRLVLAQPAISSQLIDNLNASIHLRALLTDIFIIDEALK